MKFRPTLTDQIIEENQVQIKNQGLEIRNLCDACRGFVELIKPQEVGQSHLDRMKQNQEITQHFKTTLTKYLRTIECLLMSTTAIIGRRPTRENSTWVHKELLMMTIMMKIWHRIVVWKQTRLRKANAHQKADKKTISSRAKKSQPMK